MVCPGGVFPAGLVGTGELVLVGVAVLVAVVVAEGPAVGDAATDGDPPGDGEPLVPDACPGDADAELPDRPWPDELPAACRDPVSVLA